jgi:aspartate/methionine/tyrosine aminotransferase
LPLKCSKRSAIAPFIAMDVMRAANERATRGEEVLHLEVGQPSTSAPAPVIEAAKRALAANRLGYTDALGIEPLRRRIARHYGETYGIDVDWQRVVVTTGSSGSFILAFLAAFESGDRVALASPGYPAYRNILAALGVAVAELRVGTDSNYQPTPAALDRLGGGLDGLIVASPANPTGTMLRADELRTLAGYCRERGVRLISDEIYHGITYAEPATTALAWGDDAIVINSFSKYYSMTGWRLGWMVIPESLQRSVERLAQNLFISPPTLSQYAAVTVFDCRAELDANVARYARNRRILIEQLPRAGFVDFAAADGAFYLYVGIARLADDSQEFCARMLAEIGVAVTPGIDFDPARGTHFVRFSFAGSTDEIVEAARRLVARLG